MKNTTSITSDKINVYVVSAIKSNKWGKLILTALNFGLLTLYVWFVSSIEEKEVGKLIIPVILILIVIIFLPVRYLLWNLFGKEHIIINTKTITYYHDYGIIATIPKTKAHNRLATSYEYIKTIDSEEWGKLHFISYNDTTNLPEDICETSIIISTKSIDKIHENIAMVFEYENKGFIPFSLN